MEKEKTKKQLQGVVTSDKMEGTIVVKVNRFVKHPLYKKFMKISKKYKVDDPKNAHHVGDMVTIEETKPISKDKHFKIKK